MRAARLNCCASSRGCSFWSVLTSQSRSSQTPQPAPPPRRLAAGFPPTPPRCPRPAAQHGLPCVGTAAGQLCGTVQPAQPRTDGRQRQQLAARGNRCTAVSSKAAPYQAGGGVGRQVRVPADLAHAQRLGGSCRRQRRRRLAIQHLPRGEQRSRQSRSEMKAGDMRRTALRPAAPARPASQQDCRLHSEACMRRTAVPAVPVGCAAQHSTRSAAQRTFMRAA